MEYEKIREILAGLMSVEIESINENTRFVKDLGMDSLDVFQLVAEIEDTFGIDIPSEAVGKLKTAGEAAEFVKSAV